MSKVNKSLVPQFAMIGHGERKSVGSIPKPLGSRRCEERNKAAPINASIEVGKHQDRGKNVKECSFARSKVKAVREVDTSNGG